MTPLFYNQNNQENNKALKRAKRSDEPSCLSLSHSCDTTSYTTTNWETTTLFPSITGYSGSTIIYTIDEVFKTTETSTITNTVTERETFVKISFSASTTTTTETQLCQQQPTKDSTSTQIVPPSSSSSLLLPVEQTSSMVLSSTPTLGTEPANINCNQNTDLNTIYFGSIAPLVTLSFIFGGIFIIAASIIYHSIFTNEYKNLKRMIKVIDSKAEDRDKRRELYKQYLEEKQSKLCLGKLANKLECYDDAVEYLYNNSFSGMVNKLLYTTRYPKTPKEPKEKEVKVTNSTTVSSGVVEGLPVSAGPTALIKEAKLFNKARKKREAKYLKEREKKERKERKAEERAFREAIESEKEQNAQNMQEAREMDELRNLEELKKKHLYSSINDLETVGQTKEQNPYDSDLNQEQIASSFDSSHSEDSVDRDRLENISRKHSTNLEWSRLSSSSIQALNGKISDKLRLGFHINPEDRFGIKPPVTGSTEMLPLEPLTTVTIEEDSEEEDFRERITTTRLDGYQLNLLEGVFENSPKVKDKKSYTVIENDDTESIDSFEEVVMPQYSNLTIIEKHKK